jgi:cystathionine beta-lyase/cystathionine gamma-synthase
MIDNQYPVSFNTQLVHAGEENIPEGAVCHPIFQSSTYLTGGDEKEYHDGRYIRLNNTPNQIALTKKIAAIEKAELACLFPSGMSAISSVLLALLNKDDYILAQECLYGATLKLMKEELPKLAINTEFFNAKKKSSWESFIKPTTKVIYIEAISNPLLEIADFQAIADLAKKHNIISIIDNTFATPVNFNPIDLGFDIVIHSCSKYINGHMDIVAGCIAGSKSLIQKIIYKSNYIGSCLDPNTCFLLMRSIPTLGMRVETQNKNALALACFLESHPSVKKVIYPGLESHPDHALAKKYFSGYSGMLCFELKHKEETDIEKFLSSLHIPLLAPSLGGIKTLLTRPALTSHAMMPLERKKLGISPGLMRVSVGIESSEDLIEDFKLALDTIL